MFTTSASHLAPSPITPRTTPTDITPFAIAETTEDLIELWLHGKSPNTCDAYRRDIRHFLAFINNKPLIALTLNDLQAYATALITQAYAPETQRRRLIAVKSLLTYGNVMEILPRNVGRPIKLPKIKLTIAERILSENQVLSLLKHTKNQRDHAIQRLLYATGARVSELCNLQWRDLQAATIGRGQATLFGKGQRTRIVIFSASTWSVLNEQRSNATDDDYVFRSRTGKRLHRTQIARILTIAAAQAGITAKVSPHWLRHSHASHALERGTPITVVQATLGHATLVTTGIYLHVRPQSSSALYLSI